MIELNIIHHRNIKRPKTPEDVARPQAILKYQFGTSKLNHLHW